MTRRRVAAETAVMFVGIVTAVAVLNVAADWFATQGAPFTLLTAGLVLTVAIGVRVRLADRLDLDRTLPALERAVNHRSER